MGMDFIVLLWKRLCKITFFGLKLGQDLKNQAAHPHQEFPGVSPTRGACSHEQKLENMVTLQLLEDLVGLFGKTMNKQS